MNIIRRYKALWHQRADKSSALRNEYCQRNNVFTESDLPQDQARELAKSIKRSEYDLGLLPSFFYHIRFAFYASPYILGIDQIVLSLNKLKDIPSAIRDKHKYNSLLESLKEVTKGAKEHRDSISHLEERLQGRSRQEGKIKPLPDNPESLGMIKGNAPKTVQFINFWQGRNLIYTSATGEQVRFEVSIDKFILVESLVQQMFDCLNYPEFKRSRSMF